MAKVERFPQAPDRKLGLSDGKEPGTTTLVYSLFIDGGFFLPAWVMRLEARSYMPETLLQVKKASECLE